MFGSPKRDLLQRALAMYAGDDVVAGLRKEGESFLCPHARTVELTLLFFDIASLQSPPAGMDPVTLGNYSVRYADALTDAVKTTGGTFDTFIGDAGSAWWGARGESDHARRALDCARALLKAVEHLNAQTDATREPLIKLKIGIHTGLTSLGNFGSRSRLRFTVMGDAVNLASRLCSAAPDYGRSVILSGATYDRLRDTSDIASLGSVRVKGKPDAVAIYGTAF